MEGVYSGEVDYAAEKPDPIRRMKLPEVFPTAVEELESVIVVDLALHDALFVDISGLDDLPEKHEKGRRRRQLLLRQNPRHLHVKVGHSGRRDTSLRRC
jgi:hypothetical protein